MRYYLYHKNNCVIEISSIYTLYLYHLYFERQYVLRQCIRDLINLLTKDMEQKWHFIVSLHICNTTLYGQKYVDSN